MFGPYAKAYAALLGSMCTALLGVFTADSTVGKVLTVLGILATTYATFQVKNAPEDAAGEEGSIDAGSAALGLVAGLVIAYLILR